MGNNLWRNANTNRLISCSLSIQIKFICAITCFKALKLIYLRCANWLIALTIWLFSISQASWQHSNLLHTKYRMTADFFRWKIHFLGKYSQWKRFYWKHANKQSLSDSNCVFFRIDSFVSCGRIFCFVFFRRFLDCDFN